MEIIFPILVLLTLTGGIIAIGFKEIDEHHKMLDEIMNKNKEKNK